MLFSDGNSSTAMISFRGHCAALHRTRFRAARGSGNGLSRSSSVTFYRGDATITLFEVWHVLCDLGHLSGSHRRRRDRRIVSCSTTAMDLSAK